jgi:hypothetical protein
VTDAGLPPEHPDEQPERTRFVDPPPPVASAPVDPPAAPVEQTQAVEPAEVPAAVPAQVPAEEAPSEAAAEVVRAVAPAVASAPVDTPDATVEQTRATAPTPRLLSALVVVLLAATVALTFWAWPVTSAGSTTFDYDGHAALRAAKADAKLVLAYDYRHLEDGFRAAVKVTTDADGKDCAQKVDPANKAYDPRANCFKSEYTRTHVKVVVDLATRYKTVVIADVGAAGVETVHRDQVAVLLYVNQQSTSTQSATPKITQSRVEMIMNRVGGRWLVAGINAL